MEKFLRHAGSGLLVLLLACGGMGACRSDIASRKSNVPTEKSVAHFDRFTYAGKDEFYAQHPLPGPDYFYNPILPGWNSDPSICTNGEDYFLVTSSFSYYPGVPIFHSRDLVNWTQIGHVLDRPEQLPLDGQRVSEGIFAPAISYNPHNQTYYMITTNIRRGNFFVKTKDPFGTWSDPIWLPDVHGIDPSFFFDDDGKAYIVNNDAPDGPALYEGHRAIRVQQFDPETDRTFGPRKMLVNGGIHPEEKPIWIEGPHLYKINGQYLLMAAEGGTGPDHSEVILSGDAPMGTFVPWNQNPILTQRHLSPDRPNPVTCAGHADLVQTPEGDWWAVFLACRPLDGNFENLGRETFLMPVRWSEDGAPYLTQGEERVPLVVRRPGVQRKEATTFGNFEATDEFDEATLGQEWFTLRGPATELYSLTENPGYLSLRCADVSASERNTPAFVARRMQHHQFECETTLFFEPADAHDAAGLLLFKDETHQYFLSVRQQNGQKQLALEKIGEAAPELLASDTLADEALLRLKVVSRGTDYDFYYALGKGGAWTLLCKDVPAHYLSTANSFGFTGTTIAMYATRK